MRMVALIIAEGRGTHFGKDIEKTLIELLGTFLIKKSHRSYQGVQKNLGNMRGGSIV